jgi:hypothetical protein
MKGSRIGTLIGSAYASGDFGPPRTAAFPGRPRGPPNQVRSHDVGMPAK